jgi:HrpA-like RNA helicase
MSDESPPRGSSNSIMRQAVCKDCLREQRAKELGLREVDLPDDFAKEFIYNERAAQQKLTRGQTRSDRCRRHRGQHRINIQGMAVPYIDLQTVGEAPGAHDPGGPAGPLGGLGPMPGPHELADRQPVDFAKFGFGMNERHIQEILGHLANPRTRICVVKAGTGTGKSTYMPYRLLDPPDDAAIRLADLGPIVVTEPRVQATTGVAGFVGTMMSGAGGVGPGYPVGFQVSGERAHDDSCQLIYVTDGTMINWLREGRLSTIGTVIVDEAHERSTNIDFIMGYLKKAVERYPHLRVIITSATFDERFYQWYFGGPGKVAVVRVDAVKSIGYGFPLFPDLDSQAGVDPSLAAEWATLFQKDLPLRPAQPGEDIDGFVAAHFQPAAPPLKRSEVAAKNLADVGWPENLHDATRKLVPLRFQGSVPQGQWKERMPKILGEFIVQLVRGLDEADIYGDILGFLPTSKAIDVAVGVIRDGLGVAKEPRPDDVATVYALLSTLEQDQKVKALAPQRKGDKRKIVISTNLAETSLTVEGVRFVVDSGLIAQSEWDPSLAHGGIPTKAHSQAGVRQRWGRVGRKAPGWVFPLYTKQQFLALPQDTPPGSARSNLEQLIMTAKLGGIDDVVGFDWPAKFLPPDGSNVVLDGHALDARKVFLLELERADEALRTAGAVDGNGDPTSFGKELSRSPGLGSTASTIAIMHADRLACVPEVVTVLKLLDGVSLVGRNGLLLDAQDWPDEWRLEASQRHRALASGCQDDAELALQVMAVWERAAPGVPPWVPDPAREQWARRWWINNALLLKCAEARRGVLEGLSPAMKEEVKRHVEPALVRRARGAITRAMSSLEYRRGPDGVYVAASSIGAQATGVLGADVRTGEPARIIPLKRKQADGKPHAFLSSVVTVEEWALPPAAAPGEEPTSAESAMQLLCATARSAPPDTARDTLSQLQHVWPAGMRFRLDLDLSSGEPRVGAVAEAVDPAPLPVAAPLPADGAGLQATAADGAAAVPDSGDDEASEAAPEDASPELDTSWPMPAPTEPDPGFSEVPVNLEEHDRELLACRACPACLLGELQSCEDPLVPVRDHAARDELGAWRERASRFLDVSHPRVLAEDAAALADGTWYEVAGYEVDGGAAIRLRPDWRPAGESWAPGVHPTLQPGCLVEVEVGPRLRDHRDDLLVCMHRPTGGRFLLREASWRPERQEEDRQLALSLHRRTRGLLKELKPGQKLFGHVVPRPEDGCSTLTLLATLSSHWHSRRNSYERLEATHRNGATGTRHFYRALVHGDPAGGRVTFAAAARDTNRGVLHLFGFRLNGPEGADAADSVDRAGGASGRNATGALVPLRDSDSVLVQVRPEPARLPVGGLPARALADLLRQHDGAWYPPAPPDLPGARPQRPDASPALTDLDIVPSGWLLSSKKALPAQAARDLALLNPGPRQWLSQCWYHWARSHHLQTSQHDGYRPGSAPGSIEIPADASALGAAAQVTLAAVTVRAPAPGYWLAAVAADNERLAVLFGATGLVADGDTIIAAYQSKQAAASGQAALLAALTAPAAEVTVDPGLAGKIIGKGGSRIEQALAQPGVHIYTYDRRSSRVTVVADRAALDQCVQWLQRMAFGASGRMLVPAGQTGLLIGRMGVTKDRLLAQSGCSYANPVPGQQDEWSVQGPSEQEVFAFASLAAAIVPGITVEIQPRRAPVEVFDLVRGQTATGPPSSHQWGTPDIPGLLAQGISAPPAPAPSENCVIVDAPPERLAGAKASDGFQSNVTFSGSPAPADPFVSRVEFE